MKFHSLSVMEMAVVEDYLSYRLTLRAHPMALLRPVLDAA